jgi:ABC-type transport system substrate-binding protein
MPQTGTVTFEPRGSGFDYVITTPTKRHSSGPYATKQAAGEAAQKFAEQNGINVTMNFNDVADRVDHIEEL